MGKVLSLENWLNLIEIFEIARWEKNTLLCVVFYSRFAFFIQWWVQYRCGKWNRPPDRRSIKALLWTKRCIMQRAQRKHPACKHVCTGASVQAGYPDSLAARHSLNLTPQQVLCNYIWLKSPAVTSLIEVRTSWLHRRDKNSGGASEPRCFRTVCHSSYENLFVRWHFGCVFPVTLIKTPRFHFRIKWVQMLNLVAINAIERQLHSINFVFRQFFLSLWREKKNDLFV